MTIYKNLSDLMLNNKSAQLFFDKLPLGLKHKVSEQCKSVKTLEELENFANSLIE